MYKLIDRNLDMFQKHQTNKSPSILFRTFFVSSTLATHLRHTITFARRKTSPINLHRANPQGTWREVIIQSIHNAQSVHDVQSSSTMLFTSLILGSTAQDHNSTAYNRIINRLLSTQNLYTYSLNHERRAEHAVGESAYLSCRLNYCVAWFLLGIKLSSWMYIYIYCLGFRLAWCGACSRERI